MVGAGVDLAAVTEPRLSAGLLEDELDHGVGQARVLLPGLGVVDHIMTT